MAGPARSPGAVTAFEEPEAVRVEESAAALRQPDGATGAVAAGRSVVDEATQHQKLRPGAEPLVHGVRVQRSVLAQAPVEAGEGVWRTKVSSSGNISALFGVEQEDKPHG